VCRRSLPGVPRKIFKLTLDISRSISKIKCLKRVKKGKHIINLFTPAKYKPFSADTIARRIQDMSDDIDRQLAEYFSDNQEPISKLWALQIDESTDIQLQGSITGIYSNGYEWINSKSVFILFRA
jgi:hypothetical protein